MKGRRVWLWIVLSVVGLIGVVVLGVGGLMIWGYLNLREFNEQKDTADLQARAKRMAEEYLKNRSQGALAMGLVQKGNRHFIGLGRISPTNASAPDPNTIFEIGSVTKVFTGIALAQMVREGTVALNDPIGKYLPSDVSLAAQVRGITLVQLATHTSGFPRLPDNLDLSDANISDPYARYSARDLYEGLRTVKLTGDPGRRSEYSNFGTGLLGHLLELAARVSYEQLVLDRVCHPIGLTNTAITLSPDLRARLTPGHDSEGGVVSNWTFAVLAPAGAFRSCVGDLLQFLEANLATNNPALGPALSFAQEPHFKSWLDTVGLCWQISDTAEGLRIHWHNGGTGGYASFLGFDRTHQTGVVLLSNYGDAMTGDDSLDKMGMKLLKLAAKISWE